MLKLQKVLEIFTNILTVFKFHLIYIMEIHPDNKENQGTNLTGQVDPVALHDQKDQCFIQSKLDAQKTQKQL